MKYTSRWKVTQEFMQIPAECAVALCTMTFWSSQPGRSSSALLHETRCTIFSHLTNMLAYVTLTRRA